jgi:hypothetical protein
MMFVCPQCGGTDFQLWASLDGKPVSQCLTCAETFVLGEPKLPESPAEAPTQPGGSARK